MNDLISIIIPVYNLEKYINRSVTSVLKQTYKDIEIILVDDGSSDCSWEIIESIAQRDARVKPVHQNNEGVTSARLTGVRHAAGKWIGFVDGDDEIEEDMYQRLYENAVEHQADISHCGYQMIFKDGRIHYFYNTGKLIKQSNKKGMQDLLEGSVIEPGLWNKLFSRQLFDDLLKNNRMPLDIKTNEDLLMNYYLFRKAKQSVYEDWCPYHYIVRDNSASRKEITHNRIYDPIKVKEIILKESSSDMKTVAEKALVRTALSIYEILVSEEGFLKEREDIRRIIYEHKEGIHHLPKKAAMSARMICRMPALFSVLYSMYAKTVQVKKYE